MLTHDLEHCAFVYLCVCLFPCLFVCLLDVCLLFRSFSHVIVMFVFVCHCLFVASLCAIQLCACFACANCFGCFVCANDSLGTEVCRAGHRDEIRRAHNQAWPEGRLSAEARRNN